MLIATEPVAVGRDVAAAMLGMSVQHFRRHVQPELRSIKSGQLVRYPVAELKRWVEREAVSNGRAA